MYIETLAIHSIQRTKGFWGTTKKNHWMYTSTFWTRMCAKYQYSTQNLCFPRPPFPPSENEMCDSFTLIARNILLLLIWRKKQHSGIRKVYPDLHPVTESNLLRVIHPMFWFEAIYIIASCNQWDDLYWNLTNKVRIYLFSLFVSSKDPKQNVDLILSLPTRVWIDD